MSIRPDLSTDLEHVRYHTCTWCIMVSCIMHMVTHGVSATYFLSTAMCAGMQESAAGQKALNSSVAKQLLYQHTGPVHAVHSSPFDSNLVASCGLDGCVKVVNCANRQTLLDLAPSESYLFSARWSPTKAGLLAIGAGTGRALHLVSCVLLVLT